MKSHPAMLEASKLLGHGNAREAFERLTAEWGDEERDVALVIAMQLACQVHGYEPTEFEPMPPIMTAFVYGVALGRVLGNIE